MFSKEAIHRMRVLLGDSEEPAPAVNESTLSPEQLRQRELCHLHHRATHGPPAYTVEQQRARRLAGIVEDYGSYPPAVAVRGDGVFSPSNTPPAGSEFYSSGVPKALVKRGGLPSPTAAAARVARLEAISAALEQLRAELAALAGGSNDSNEAAHGQPMLCEQATFRVTATLNEQEGQSGGTRVRGVIQRSGVKNHNQRVYPHHLMRREVNRMQEKIRRGEIVLASLDHPGGDGVSRLANAAAIWRDISISDDGIVTGEAELLRTSAGKTLAEILKTAGKVGASSRGFGTTKAGPSGEQTVSEDYSLVSFDFIDGPSTPNAYVTAVQ